MGIQGLLSCLLHDTKYIFYFFELRDTYLIIDGNSLMHEIWRTSEKNYYYGGDYVHYAQSVRNFFDLLIPCNITPIIVLDGCVEDRRMYTKFERKVRDLVKCRRLLTKKYEGIDWPRAEAVSFFGEYVFLEVLRKRNVKMVRTIFEADKHIAALATVFDCPVLSNDSDFLIYNVKFLPFGSLTREHCFNFHGNCYLKARIFHRNSFLRMFAGRVESRWLLPLCAAILGNDHMNSQAFKRFFETYRVTADLGLEYKTRFKTHLRVKVLLEFFMKYPIDIVIKKIVDKSRDKLDLIKKIEIVMNEYLIYSKESTAEMLAVLGCSNSEITRLTKKLQNLDGYEFRRPANPTQFDSPENENEDYFIINLNVGRITNEELIREIAIAKELSESEIRSSQYLNIVVPEVEDKFDDVIPIWFKRKYIRGHYPTYFLDIINRQHVFSYMNIENLIEPPSFLAILKILSVIFRLLRTKHTKSDILNYTIRENATNIKTCEMDCREYDLNINVPMLRDLPEVTLKKRKSIMNRTLGISQDLMDKFPPNWKIYIAAIKYWKVTVGRRFATKTHEYALILQMMFYFVKEKIRTNTFSKKKIAIEDVDMIRPIQKSLRDAFKHVTDDCLSLIDYFEVKIGSLKNNKFDINVVHGFTLFQNCLIHSLDLNNLLDYPYDSVDIGEFYQSSLLFYLHTDLSSHEMLNRYITTLLSPSPSVLQLFICIAEELRSS